MREVIVTPCACLRRGCLAADTAAAAASFGRPSTCEELRNLECQRHQREAAYQVCVCVCVHAYLCVRMHEQRVCVYVFVCVCVYMHAPLADKREPANLETRRKFRICSHCRVQRLRTSIPRKKEEDSGTAAAVPLQITATRGR